MKGPKWLLMLLAALALTFVVWGSINVAVDPFGSFGDKLLSFDAYSMTLNPRVGKINYLSEHRDDYDSYVIGSSSAASYLPETLERYDGGSWYNLFHYGADITYDRQLVSWLLANDDVRHIVLVLGLSEADTDFEIEDLTDRAHCAVSGENPISYYANFLFAGPSYAAEKLTSVKNDTEMPQAFDVFLPDSGTYDKRLRDAESIGDTEAYLAKNGGDFWSLSQADALRRIDLCVSEVEKIQTMCRDASVKLTVILSPVYEGQLNGFTDESLTEYFTKLAVVTPFWNFSISSLSYDARYFYDTTHTRNATADLVLARIYGDDAVYTPDGFGILCEKGAVPEAAMMRSEGAKSYADTPSVNIPILLYHHIDPNAEESGTTVHPDTFARHMALLAKNGFTTITFDQVADYVESGTPLPEKPVIVTFDDGYYSNYEYAFPILRGNGQNAAIFLIGSSIGHMKTYKNTNFPITPHFGATEIREMTLSGMDLQSHTFDMHQWPPYETGDAIRETVLPLENEGEADYIAALIADLTAEKDIFASLGLAAPTVMAFPAGKWTDIANVILMEYGYKITLTTDATRCNTLVQGLPQSLIGLGRLNVGSDTTEEDLLLYCAMGTQE